jgi:myo-inositol-1(or 4)-monophosphatase
MLNSMNLSPYLDVAIRAARAAGAIHLYYRDQELNISSKTTPADLVTLVDHLAEEKIREILLEAYGDHSILGEEGGEIGSHEFRWVVDPLDGTVNYAHGFPMSCVSIGLEIGGVRSVGAVYDANREELFTAVLGGGAFLNGRKISVSSCSDLMQPALLATGFPYNVSEDRTNFSRLERFLNLGLPVRRPGSAALDLCYVACGRLDGFWEYKLKPWDMSAGLLILEEAGGQFSNLEGGTFQYGEGLCSSNGPIQKQMLEVLRG